MKETCELILLIYIQKIITYTRFLYDFEEALKGQMSIALQKDSELSDLIDYHLLKLRQSGILEALKLKWLDGREAGDWSGRIFRGEEPGGVGADNLFPRFSDVVGDRSGIGLSYGGSAGETRKMSCAKAVKVIASIIVQYVPFLVFS